MSRNKSSNILAYAAGVIDGKGSISISHSYTKSKGHSYREYRLCVNVTNTNELLVHWFQFQFGGTTGKYKRLHLVPNAKDCYKWTIGSKAARNFLELIIPYLIIKRPQAELAMLFQGRKVYGGKGRGKRKPEQAWIQEEADRILMSTMNKKGSDDGNRNETSNTLETSPF